MNHIWTWPIHLGHDHFISVVTISFWSWPNHYGQVQINLFRPKPFWTNQNCFGLIEGEGKKMLGLIEKLKVLMTFRIGCWIRWTAYSMKIFSKKSNFDATILLDRTVIIQHSKDKISLVYFFREWFKYWQALFGICPLLPFLLFNRKSSIWNSSFLLLLLVRLGAFRGIMS